MKNFKHIKKFGFELEGGWEEGRFDTYEAKGIMKEDGSVDVAEGIPGEIATEPFDCLKKAWKFMEEHYPDEVNRTCGFHIHISVSDGDYAVLMEKDFYDAFVKWAEKIGKKYKKRLPATYESRLKGKNNYCQKKFEPDKQVKGSGDRYTQLNYCYRAHKTLENRMFPGCKNARTAFFLLTQYLAFVEDYLEKNKLESKIYESEVEIEVTSKGELICA